MNHLNPLNLHALSEGDTFPLSAAMHSEHDLHYANWICKGASAT